MRRAPRGCFGAEARQAFLAPRTLVTTTPKAVPLLKKLVETSALTRGRTPDNLNLPEARVAQMEAEYGGTRKGRKELDGELIEDVEGRCGLGSWWRRGGWRRRWGATSATGCGS